MKKVTLKQVSSEVENLRKEVEELKEKMRQLINQMHEEKKRRELLSESIPRRGWQ